MPSEPPEAVSKCVLVNRMLPEQANCGCDIMCVRPIPDLADEFGMEKLRREEARDDQPRKVDLIDTLDELCKLRPTATAEKVVEQFVVSSRVGLRAGTAQRATKADRNLPEC